MSPSEPTFPWFARLMAVLAENFEFISLAEASERTARGALTGRTMSVTFDDGYADNFGVALPVLKELGIPTTFFVASGFLNGGRMWNDSIIETVRRLDDGTYDFGLPDQEPFHLHDWESRRLVAANLIRSWKHLPPEVRQQRVDSLSSRVNDLPTNLMMSSDQLRKLADTPGMTVGGHTRSHPILASLDAARAFAEIESGKRDLEAIIERDVTLFAYPNGKRDHDYRAEHKEMVRAAGFSAAVSTNWGAMDVATDYYEIPRFTPWHTSIARFSIDLARCHHGLI